VDDVDDVDGDVFLRHVADRLGDQCTGLVAQAASQAAHAVLAARGQWVTNEKTLLTRAGLRQVDEFIATAGPDPGVPHDVVDSSRALCRDAVNGAIAAAMVSD
jgi:hypothetical protein